MTETATRPYLALIITAIGIAMLFGSRKAEGQNVVLRDHFDIGIDGWVYVGEPQSVMAWDVIEGNPDAGSLRLSTPAPLQRHDFSSAFGPCMDSVPGTTWTIQAVVRKTGSVYGDCTLSVYGYDGFNCTNKGTTTGGPGIEPPIAPDVWHIIDATRSPFYQAQSVRPVLLKYVPPGVAMSCHLDSVVVSNDRLVAAAEIPTLSGLGLLVVATTLAAFAVVLLVRYQRRDV